MLILNNHFKTMNQVVVLIQPLKNKFSKKTKKKINKSKRKINNKMKKTK